MHNTQCRLIQLAGRRGIITAIDAVFAFYRVSQQPRTKARTMHRHLRRMQRNGFMGSVTSRGDALAHQAFYATDLGLREARRGSALPAPRFPRLAGTEASHA